MAEINPNGAAMLALARKQIADAPTLFVDVPEWPDADGKPSRIWYRATMTVAERFDIFGWKAGAGDYRYRHVYTLIRRALDAKGNPLFSAADEQALLELDAAVVMRLSDTLIAPPPTVADAKKGSETIPTD